MIEVKTALTQGTASKLGVLFPSLPVKYPGLVFFPPDDQKYIEVVLLSNDNGRTWGKDIEYAGFIRLIVHWPVDGSGPFVPYQMQTDIANAFAKGTVFSFGNARLQLNDVPKIMDMIEDGQEILFPVSCRYEYFAPET